MKSIQTRLSHKTVELWFQDETRVGQKGRLTRFWGLKGARQRVKKDFGFANAYIFGAICPERDVGEAIVTTSVNKIAMQEHLNIMSQSLPSHYHAALVMDQAPWHKNLKWPDNITPIY